MHLVCLLLKTPPVISTLRQSQILPAIQQVLVVEDDPVARRALKRLLSATGFITHAVATAEEALCYLNGHNAPLIALIDLDLPGISGLELIRQLEQSNPAVIPVLITAAGPERLDGQPRQPRHYIRKPLDFQYLLDVLSQGATAQTDGAR